MAMALLMTGVAAGSARADASQEADFVSRINALRTGLGLVPLHVDAQLTGIARSWAQHMAGAGNISHRSNLADGVTAVWHLLGENVGVGNTVAELEAAFVASPHHYENLVNPDFRGIGVGVVAGNGQLWVAEEFIAYARSSAPAPTPTTSTAPRRPAPRGPAPRGSPSVATPQAGTPAPAGSPPPGHPSAPAAAAVAPAAVPTRVIAALAVERVLDSGLGPSH
jgi:hypothetical protein